MNLWLDDIRDPHDHGAIGYTWVKTAEEAIAALKTGRVRFATLDHDLSVEGQIRCQYDGGEGRAYSGGYEFRPCLADGTPVGWPSPGT